MAVLTPLGPLCCLLSVTFGLPTRRLADFALTPRCVNGLNSRPAQDEEGRDLRCHPGLTTSNCPSDYSCLFNGIDFYCCPMDNSAKTPNDFLLLGMEEDRLRDLKFTDQFAKRPQRTFDVDKLLLPPRDALSTAAKTSRTFGNDQSRPGVPMEVPPRVVHRQPDQERVPPPPQEPPTPAPTASIGHFVQPTFESPAGKPSGLTLEDILSAQEIRKLSLDPTMTLEQLLTPTEMGQLYDLLATDDKTTQKPVKEVPTTTTTARPLVTGTLPPLNVASIQLSEEEMSRFYETIQRSKADQEESTLPPAPYLPGIPTPQPTAKPSLRLAPSVPETPKVAAPSAQHLNVEAVERLPVVQQTGEERLDETFPGPDIEALADSFEDPQFDGIFTAEEMEELRRIQAQIDAIEPTKEKAKPKRKFQPAPQLHEILSPKEIRELQLTGKTEAFFEDRVSQDAFLHRHIASNLDSAPQEDTNFDTAPADETFESEQDETFDKEEDYFEKEEGVLKFAPKSEDASREPFPRFVHGAPSVAGEEAPTPPRRLAPNPLPPVANFDGPLTSDPGHFIPNFSEASLREPSEVRQVSPERRAPPVGKPSIAPKPSIAAPQYSRERKELAAHPVLSEAEAAPLDDSKEARRPEARSSTGALETRVPDDVPDFAAIANSGAPVSSPALRYALEQFRNQRPDGTMVFYQRGGDEGRVFRGPPVRPTTAVPQAAGLDPNTRYNYEYARWLTRYGTRHQH